MKRLFLSMLVMAVCFTGVMAQDDAKKAEENAKMIKEKAEGDAAYSKLETVKDLSGLTMNNIIPEAKKLTAGNEYIKGNFRIKVPISLVSFVGEMSATDPEKDFATLEVIDFGNLGNTILISIEIASADLYATFSFSGENAYICPTTQGGNDMFAMVRKISQSGMVGALAPMEGKWALLLMSKDGLVSSFHKGMKRSEVQEICGQLGLSSFKETGKTAKYTICSLYWLDMQKQYDIFGNYNYQMRNDKKYGDFYFDANGRLMKWFLFM